MLALQHTYFFIFNLKSGSDFFMSLGLGFGLIVQTQAGPGACFRLYSYILDIHQLAMKKLWRWWKHETVPRL